MSDDDLLIYFKLCKSGYARSIAEAKELGPREVLQALAYESFSSEYQRVYMELNSAKE